MPDEFIGSFLDKNRKNFLCVIVAHFNPFLCLFTPTSRLKNKTFCFTLESCERKERRKSSPRLPSGVDTTNKQQTIKSLSLLDGLQQLKITMRKPGVKEGKEQWTTLDRLTSKFLAISKNKRFRLLFASKCEPSLSFVVCWSFFSLVRLFFSCHARNFQPRSYYDWLGSFFLAAIDTRKSRKIPNIGVKLAKFISLLDVLNNLQF